MQVDAFLGLAEALTGTPVKDVTATDKAFLGTILANDDRQIDCSQLNELLLLVNKDRMETPFFQRFFGDDCRVALLTAGVARFQQMAMLRYGNFIYAYRTLARFRTNDELKRELGEYGRTQEEIKEAFDSRSAKLLDIELIAREDTPLVGYLSAREIIAENERALLLQSCLPPAAQLPETSWEAFEQSVRGKTSPGQQRPVLGIAANYRVRQVDATVADFAGYIGTVVPKFNQRSARLDEVQSQATRNQDIYLTWDHMDVYFATSMRKSWEFRDLFDFVQGVMADADLASLKLRWFDPTQSYTTNRVNKGLVESLMLKRAKCTVYSVQDTDTLGKDSELAATLAQGKPVIAYVPQINPEERAGVLLNEDPVTIQERLRFVYHADEGFLANLTADDQDFVQNFQALQRFEQQRIWRSLPDPEAVASLRAENKGNLDRLCRIIAASEARIYDSRARTLRDFHPLAIQVNLDTGVANGVLVVRTIPDCARLLRRVLSGTMEFTLERNQQDRMWYLRETISECVYRVVSLDRKLTNCFWNFYLRQQGQ